MAEMFAIRNVDDKTKEFITTYAESHDMTMAEALREIVLLVQAHLSEKPKKKYSSIFEVYDQLKFSSDDPKLSEKIDEIVYGE